MSKIVIEIKELSSCRFLNLVVNLWKPVQTADSRTHTQYCTDSTCTRLHCVFERALRTLKVQRGSITKIGSLQQSLHAAGQFMGQRSLGPPIKNKDHAQ